MQTDGNGNFVPDIGPPPPTEESDGDDGDTDGAAQTPWTNDIDAAGFNLTNLGTVNGVKVYRALLTQTGLNAPVPAVLENSLGADPVFAYSGSNFYTMTLAGAFPVNKTFPLPLGASPSGDYGANSVFRVDDNTIAINFAEDAGVAYPFILEVLVFPA